jgi:oligopeptidase B
VIAPRRAGVEYTVDHGGSWFYIRTNLGGATNFKVMRAPVTAPSDWQEFIAYRGAVFVEDVLVFKDWLIRSERRDGLRRINVRSLASGEEHEVTFDDAAYAVALEANPEFATGTLRFTFQSLITPPTVYDYDLATRQRVVKKKQEVLGGYDPAQYTVEWKFATSNEGDAATPVRIPVSIVYKGKTKPSSRPLLIYAYGAYGSSTEPTFNSARISLLDRGFVFAIAHVRGGQEMGRGWYDAGKMMHKQNSINDFIDVTDFMVGIGYADSRKVVANGGSAAGLIMGAIANIHQDRYRAIVADVPFVDLINSMADASIPLTSQEWEQWGNPHNPAEYKYMREYSPYDNVAPHAFPWILVMSGLNDSRVAYWEPSKWVAKMRAAKAEYARLTRTPDDTPLLLHMLMGAGHGGSSGRYERMHETALRYAFMLDAVGLVRP